MSGKKIIRGLKEAIQMSDGRLEEARAFVRSALSRFPDNASVSEETIEKAARKIVKAFRFLDKGRRQ